MKENNGFKRIVLYILKWFALGLLTGIVCGGAGTLFAKAIAFVTAFRGKYPQMLFFLPVGGIVSVFCISF